MTEDSTNPGRSADSPGDDDEREWRFSVEDVGPDGIIEQERDPIEPGSPKIEHAVFVLLGIVVALALLFAATP